MWDVIRVFSRGDWKILINFRLVETYAKLHTRAYFVWITVFLMNFELISITRCKPAIPMPASPAPRKRKVCLEVGIFVIRSAAIKPEIKQFSIRPNRDNQ